MRVRETEWEDGSSREHWHHAEKQKTALGRAWAASLCAKPVPKISFLGTLVVVCADACRGSNSILSPSPVRVVSNIRTVKSSNVGLSDLSKVDS